MRSLTAYQTRNITKVIKICSRYPDVLNLQYVINHNTMTKNWFYVIAYEFLPPIFTQG